MIKLSKIRFQYKDSDFHLSFDSLHVKKKESVAVIGPSGCGKTTLMHLIAGILPNQSGEILIDEKAVNEMNDSERRFFRIRNIGFVFQDFALLDYLSFYDNILHPYRINPALELTKKVKDRAVTLAENLGIKKQLKSYPGKTSQGEKQRAAICRALLNEPRVILADEPTGNLDPSNKQAILDILKNYVREHEAALLVATHDHDLLKSFDDVIDFKEVRSSK